MVNSRKKRGRKARYALYNGREIEGLYVVYNSDKSVRNFYYLDQNKRQVSCTSDPTEAIRRFRNFQGVSVQTVKVSGIGKQVEPDNNEIGKAVETFERRFKFEKKTEGEYTLTPVHTITDLEIITRFVELLKKDPYRVSELSGIPQFAHVEDIKLLPKSLTCQNLLDIYTQKSINPKYLYYVKTYFLEFKNIVEKPEIRQITYDDISKYEKTIYTNAEKETVSNKTVYINKRFEAVRSVLRYAKKKNEYKNDITRLIEFLEQVTYKKTTPQQITILSKKDFQSLYQESQNNIFAKCILLLGMNCGLRIADISDMRKQNLDLKNGYFSKPRTKSGIVQSSILWKETIKALKDYMAEKPTETDHVFLTTYNNPYTYDYMIEPFNKLREKCELSINHKQLRISANSIANRFNCNRDSIKIFMGWSISHVDNSYNDRHPAATIDVCKSVYKYYFGK